jgi:hypothetical protein
VDGGQQLVFEIEGRSDDAVLLIRIFPFQSHGFVTCAIVADRFLRNSTDDVRPGRLVATRSNCCP